MIEVETRGAVRLLTLNDPDQRNALDYDGVAELLRHLQAADSAPDVRCVVITGAGSVFSAGADLAQFELELDESASEMWTSGAGWHDLFVEMPALGIPVVCAVNGAAMAGGCGIVALADVALSSDRARFGLTEIRIGLFPLMVWPAVRLAVGDRIARELALTGRIFGADEAAAMGLISRVVPHDDLLPAAMEIATGLAAQPPAALALGRRYLNQIRDLTYRDAVAFGQAIRPAFLHSPELREGVRSFLEKRPPSWKGNHDAAS